MEASARSQQLNEIDNQITEILLSSEQNYRNSHARAVSFLPDL